MFTHHQSYTCRKTAQTSRYIFTNRRVNSLAGPEHTEDPESLRRVGSRRLTLRTKTDGIHTWALLERHPACLQLLADFVNIVREKRKVAEATVGLFIAVAVPEVGVTRRVVLVLQFNARALHVEQPLVSLSWEKRDRR